MKPITMMYVGAVVLFLMAACSLGLGGFIFLGSLGGASVGSLHIILAVLGVLAALVGVALIVAAVRKTKAADHNSERHPQCGSARRHERGEDEMPILRRGAGR